MWRPLARRASLYRRTAAPRLRPAIEHLQVPHHETATLPLLSIESASRLSLFSRTSHFHQNPRFFSSSSAENHEDLTSEPIISEGNEITNGFDSGTMNEFHENSKPDDSIFDDAISNLEVDKCFGEILDGSVDLDENLDAVAIEDENLEQVKTNDPEMVERLLSLLQSSGTVNGSLESNLEEMDLVLVEDFMLKVLETPYIPGENLIGFFRWVLKKPEFKLSTVVLDALVSAICIENRKRDAYALWDLINEVGEKEKGVVSTESLNTLVAEFSRLGKGKVAFDVFNKFEEFGCHINADTYYFTIEALCRRSFYSWASSVCEKMLNADKLPDIDRVGKIISFFCKGGMTKDAHLVYLYAKDKKIYPPKSSINFLITSLSRIERTGKEINKELDMETVSLALEMLNDYSVEDRKYAIKPFSSVIKKLCWIEDVDRAKKLLLEMIDSGPPPGNEIFNCVINGLTKNGDMGEALNMMKLMEKRGLKPDVYTYSVIMSGYTRDGEMEEACKIFDEAKKKHSILSPITYHTLIRGFCKLEQYDKAVSLLGEMKEHGVQPNHDEYNKLIKSLCLKALDWETAEKLEEEMRADGLILNGRTRALINAVKELKEGVSTEIPAPA
ncbi:hypothetical protein DH2020_034006 [Rehmannia glutinosa]|uniref:Pentatricopeptide repeat-containing protein n=1 Tax=Rehmannia glutinosa TaxID=99300 RepID=A0ABR0VB16_REHGL